MMAAAPSRPFAGFQFADAEELLSGRRTVPDKGGVYALFVRGGDELLVRAGYSAADRGGLDFFEGRCHLYVGESYGIGSRIREHLTGTFHGSNFRQSLLALQVTNRAIDPLRDEFVSAAEAESWITGWLRARTVVGFKNCPLVGEAEAELLRLVTCPLNIAGKKASEFRRSLTAARRVMREQTWAQQAELTVPKRRYRR